MGSSIHIIACSVFKDAISELAGRFSDKTLSFRFLTSNLHIDPKALKNVLLSVIEEANTTEHCVGCLYGICFPDIDACLNHRGVWRCPRDHCYEVFLGRHRYHRLMDEHPGTFFVEKELLLNFDDLCRGPLELDDPDIRETIFSHYSQVAYIRQPRDPDLSTQARKVADLLGLNLTILDADYSELKRLLEALCSIQRDTKKQ